MSPESGPFDVPDSIRDVVMAKQRPKVGVTLKSYTYATYRPLRLDQIAEQARRAEALGLDSVWVMDHLLIDRPDGRVLSHDPILCLAHAAAATNRVELGSMVLCNSFRPTAQLAREAAALADLSHGRFILGLGAGWHGPEFEAFGLPFDHLAGRMEEAFEPLRGLLRGDRISIDGRWLKLKDASLAVTSEPPPLWVAARGPRMLALAARSAQGWNHTQWGAEDTGIFRSTLASLDLELERHGRCRADVQVSANIACVPGGWREVPGAFRTAEVATGSTAAIAATIREYGDAGADHIILSMSPDPYAELDSSLLETAAEIRSLV